MSEVIVITSGKGGVGKTTTTANVGTGLAQLNKKVVLIDTDIGLRNLDVVMGLENRILYNLVDVLSGRCRVKQAVIRDKRFPNLSIIPSSCTKEKNPIDLQKMKLLLQDLREDFDYILIDSPAGIDQGFSLATADVDRIVVVTTPQIAAIHDADCVLQILKKQKRADVCLLINGFRRHMVKDGDMLDVPDICELLDAPLLGVVLEDENIIIGNVALYGATSGKAFINGVAGERFCVRNSGATAVVEGCGDHGCEYMTGGRVVVLGTTGKNFAAGMSGGIAYVLDEDATLYRKVNKTMVSLEPVTDKYDVLELKEIIAEHVAYTNSQKGKKIFDHFSEYLPKFKKIVPHDYKKMMMTIVQMEEKGLSSEQAQIEAFNALTR